LTKPNSTYRKFQDLHKESFNELTNKLNSFDAKSSILEQYTKDYLQKYLNNIEYEIQLNSRLVFELFKGLKTPIEELTVLDIGGGVGIMSMMLVSMGVGNVIYLDQNSAVTKDAELLAETLGFRAHRYLSSSLEHIPSDVASTIDIALSRDVLEHIYDLYSLDFSLSPYPNLKRMVHNTSANLYCLWLRKYFEEVHRESEKEGVISKTANGGYWQDRYEYLLKDLGIENTDEARELATATRGLNYADMANFLENREYPFERHWASNTCDPTNGNWSERLLPVEEYRKWARNNGFSVELKGGILNSNSGNVASRVSKSTLNVLITNNMCGPTLWPSLTFIMDRL